jgi:hypothetical protein
MSSALLPSEIRFDGDVFGVASKESSGAFGGSSTFFICDSALSLCTLSSLGASSDFKDVVLVSAPSPRLADVLEAAILDIKRFSERKFFTL